MYASQKPISPDTDMYVGASRVVEAFEPEPRVLVRALLDNALLALSDNPDAARTSISKAVWLLSEPLEQAVRPYRLLPVAGALNGWQEQRAKELLEAGLIGNFTLAEIARVCELDLPTFKRAFRLTTGLSPGKWQRAYRIRLAQKLLFDSVLSLAQIAYDCGFADQAHFTRTFAAATGTSPGIWRRARRAS